MSGARLFFSDVLGAVASSRLRYVEAIDGWSRPGMECSSSFSLFVTFWAALDRLS
jgi:hypothetical protein